ncbi:hypothetical protein ABVK25_007131 [Lepraria finkii]|uniref:Ribosomal protein S2 n=1 Tax=Lepraria finkii TaxID=1340010 RepID=A0ABR4B3W6_9LECA
MMIIRKALIRLGRRIAIAPARSWTRALATEVDIASIESSPSNSLRDTKSIESQVQNETVKVVPQIGGRTQSTQNLLEDNTAAKYAQLQQHKKLTNPLGSRIAPHYQPHFLVNDPPRPSDITLELLLASQAHLGHKTSHWNPINSRYIFGIRQGIHIISLDVTASHLRRACRVVAGVAERGGLILFVGTRPGQDRCVVKAAQMAGGCHLFERWTPGSITNGHQILGNCRTKVVDEYDREISGYDEELRDRPVLKPDLVVCMNPLENWVMLHECGLNAIPTIGIIDTDANPTWVTYPIPANDDSLRCVQVIAGVLGRAGEEGQKSRREKAMHGNVTYTPSALATGVSTKRGRMGRSREDTRGPQ